MTTTLPAGATSAPVVTPENTVSTEIAPAAPIATNLPDLVRYAEHLAQADMLPKGFSGRPANVLYAMEYGRTLGITPIAALTGIHVIEGKPSASSGLIGGLVRRAGHKLRVKGNDREATAQIIRADDPDWVYEVTWTIERAVTAGLCTLKDDKPYSRDKYNKPKPWEAYPAAMLKARAITEVARDACEDVLYGLHYTPEELGAYVDQDGMPVDAPVQPLRVVPATPSASAPMAAAADLAKRAAEAATLEDWRPLWDEARDGQLLTAVVHAPDDGQQCELGQYLTRRGTTLKAAAAVEPEDGVPDAEIVEPDQDEHAAAVDELRSAALAAGVADTVETDFAQSYGTTVNLAAPAQLREMANLLRGAA